jgi:MSHA biogenesis protein MshO
MARSASGFTLIELIAVILILGLLSSFSAGFIVDAVDSYRINQERALIAATGRQALERMTRQLRGALPYSIRIVNGGSCLQFMPLAGGGQYLSPVPDSANGASARSSISVAPHGVDFGSASYLAIGAMGPTELYGISPVSRASLSSRTATSLTLTAAKIWQRNSPTQRFYLLDSPQAFCVLANQLRFFANQDVSTASVNTAGASSLMAASVTSTTPFTLLASTDLRNINVQINLTFVQGRHQMNFAQEVMLRNVP